MITITAYKTNDGILFSDEESAKKHENESALRVAHKKLSGLLNDEFNECYMTFSTVAKFIVKERKYINLVLNRLDESISAINEGK